MKPRLLDLFCGAGGAGMGYHRAGFEVVGVDIAPQPHYPFEFHQADALTYPLDGVDVIHASPPCQAYSPHVTSRSSRWVPTLGKDEPRLIAAVRERISSLPYVIENVAGAARELRGPTLLCGQMFGLPIRRHRLFETSWPIPWTLLPPHFHPVPAKAWAEAHGWDYRDMTATGKGRRAGTADRWRELLGIDWPTTQHELAESIPPAFTEWIGRQLLAVLEPRGMTPDEMHAALTVARSEGCIAPLLDPDCGPCRDGFRIRGPKSRPSDPPGRQWFEYRGHVVCSGHWFGYWGARDGWLAVHRRLVDQWIEEAA